MIKIFICFILGIATSCNSITPTSQEIVNKAIITSGTDMLRNTSISFTFRNINYEYTSQNGRYTYSRIQRDTIGNVVKDVLTNNGLKHYLNNEELTITDEKRTAYAASVNSVIYFAFLPLWLNDAAVNKSYEGTINIDDKSYYKIKVTFDAKGGGEDHEDVFYYWFDTEDYSMDYLAYSYIEEKGRGMRFRIAYNARKINGVIIQDYKNLKPKVKDSIALINIDQAYLNNELEELSLIELENVEITHYSLDRN